MTRYYVHDGESYDASYTTPGEARKAAIRALDGWADEAASVAWGEVREIATAIPHAGVVEEDGLDDRGVDYELRAPDEDLTRAALTTPEAYVGAMNDAVVEELERLRADLAALRIEHDAWGAIIDATREDRDEARRERDEIRAQLLDSNAELLATAAALNGGESCDAHLLHQRAVDVVRERDELRAALLNERGEGEPPSEGWTRNDFDKRRIGIAWYRPANADGSLPPADATSYTYAMWVYRESPETGWTWECECEWDNAKDIRGKAPTARRAMLMADAALAGGKS